MSDTFKQDKLKDFTIIRNAIFKDYRLSAKAVGVACKLLSLPPTWDYSVRGLTTLFSDGEASIRSALTELEDAGYLHRERVREAGKLGKSIYVITDMLKSEKPNVENPLVDNPVVENHAQLNTKELNTNQSNTNQYSHSSKSGSKRFLPPSIEEVSAYINEKGYQIDAEQFVDFYQCKGWKVGKDTMTDWKAAVRTWERRRKENHGDSGSRGNRPSRQKSIRDTFAEIFEEHKYDL